MKMANTVITVMITETVHDNDGDHKLTVITTTRNGVGDEYGHLTLTVTTAMTTPTTDTNNMKPEKFRHQGRQ